MEILNANLTALKEARASFAGSAPYLHAVVDSFVHEDRLRKIRDEILAHLHFTEKETDIYRINQTGDLANMSRLPEAEKAQLGTLLQLRDNLYSREFRAYLSQVTGCGPLSGSKMDMSINHYTQGCHLLNHDDVIGTRRVSFILYMPDPEQDWEPEMGGALELYPVVAKGVPANVPQKTIQPVWNRFVFFTVQPGHSFHSVEEVVGARGRLTISGWFHLPEAHEEDYSEAQAVMQREAADAAQPSLQQLSAAIADFVSYPSITDPTETDLSISAADVAALSKFVSPQYLKPGFLVRISEQFAQESVIQLDKFLLPAFSGRLKRAIQRAECATSHVAGRIPPHDTGVDGQWTIAGPPHRQRFLSLATAPTATPVKNDDELASLLGELAELMRGDAFKKFTTALTSLTLLSQCVKVRRFRPGLDYALARSSADPILDATLNLTPSGGWDDETLGGWECYMPSEDADAEGDDGNAAADPAVYAQAGDGDEEPLLVSAPAWNSLQLVLRDAEVPYFVKYLSAMSDDCRWDIRAEYEFYEEESDDDEDEEEDAQGSMELVDEK